MRRASVVFLCALILGAFTAAGAARQSGPYSVIKTAKTGGDGGFDYVYADVAGRRLYVPRSGQGARVTVFDLDTLESVGAIPNTNGVHGAAVDPKSGHGFASSNPIVMFDTKTLATIKTIDPGTARPDGIMFDPFNQRVHVLSHGAPNDTVINAVDGSVVGTIDLGGAPEQAQSDGKGHIYVDLEDKNAIAAVDAKDMKVTATYDVSAKCGGPAGLGLDVKNHILFATCHSAGTEGEQGKASMVIVNADTGKILTSLPIGSGTDGGGFNPNTMEAFSSNGTGTLSIVKESSPTSFAVEQDLQTKVGAKTMTIDTKTNHVLLITAEYAAPAAPPGGGAPPARGGRGGRGQMVPDSFSILVVGKS